MTSELCDRHWDVIVIGTGIGGGTIGRHLAENGLAVLFLEKGHAGQRSATNGLGADTITDPTARMTQGWWPDRVSLCLNGRETQPFVPIGAGVGGSSVFYAATLERPEAHDLDDSAERPHPTGGWPVNYHQMLPYYDRAEALYHVRGETDPLNGHSAARLGAPLPIAQGDSRMMQRMRAGGLHPYQLHTALRHLDGCTFCFGRKCPRDCKMDARSAGIEPALKTGRAALLDRCEVTELVGRPDRITHVIARRDDEQLTFSAERVVLAAGALSSPRLLLNSRAEHWPHGCGNGNDLVGRNLMFHLNEMFALWPRRGEAFREHSKSIGFRDLYFAEGLRFGMVQSMGLNIEQGDILHYLRRRIARSRLRCLPGAHQLARVPAIIAAQVFGRAKVFVGLLEDLPYAENRVLPDPARPGGIRIDYGFSEELLERRLIFRRLLRSALKGQKSLFLTHDPEPNLGHPCGTLRMGANPATSVLDPACRVHGLCNLWVVDASFMPTSMGVNPSLTIAANALRVADQIAERQ
ncbi:GMC oxidoreductase [Pontibaca salina]|uniref:GMC family oxidoreductase n=1 Tax=Pontibaca salina TaxID=2795731 RepID=A0A934HSQ9_9RHOB|nr:GMC family oxidoreductase [Pontibaca salina]MBI6629528.1 GMC family oxidoreductase [Pontibaca salina]